MRGRRSVQSEALKETEAQRSYSWRCSQLKRGGMPPLLAMRVADSDMDLHVALKALENGCSPELLVEIAT